MRPGMECLLEILREAGRTDRAHPVEPPQWQFDESQWQDAIDLAEQHRVLPWVAAQVLDGRGSQLPVAVEVRLREARRAATIAAFLWTSELKSLLAEFASASIPVLVLKGLWFAQRIYGNAALRSSRDIDLLVRKDRFGAAEKLLQTIGFTSHACADDYHREWRRGTLAVELHFDVENPLAFDFDIESVWKRAHPATFEGQPGWTLAPADELLYLCLHGTRHRFDRLSRVLDIALALRQLSLAFCQADCLDSQSDLDLPAGLEHLQPLLELGCALALRLRPDCIPPGRSPVVASPHILQLASRLWHHVLDEPAGQRLDWVAQHRFYLEIEATPRQRLKRRLRHLRILAGRIIQEDYDFAAQLGVRRRWMVWALRPLRLGLQAANLRTKQS